MFTLKNISFIIFLFCSIIGIISIIKKIRKISLLSENDKAILKDCKSIVANQKRKIDLIRNILIIIFIAIASFFGVVLLKANIDSMHVADDPSLTISHFAYDKLFKDFYFITFCFTIVYTLIRSITYILFTRSIHINNELTDKQKDLLKLYYNNRYLLYILIAILIITLRIMLEPSRCF